MSPLRRLRAAASTAGSTLALLVAISCARQSTQSTQDAAPNSRPMRLVNPEDVIVVPLRSPWLAPATPLRFESSGPPPMTRDGKIDAQLTAAFVVNEQGSVEMQTVGFVEERGLSQFRDIVCEMLAGASFAWREHEPARGLTMMGFSFGNSPTPMVPIRNDLVKRVEVLSTYTPTQLAQWVERLPHCR